MANASSKQNVFVIFAAVAVVLASVLVTLYATGVLRGDKDGKVAGFQNVTFTDAVLTCRDHTSSTYGQRIRNLVTDNHSSRFDNGQYLYKIFLKMDLYDKKMKNVNLHYINCFVRSSNGNIRKFEVFKDVDENKNKDSDDTNMFGMPKKG